MTKGVLHDDVKGTDKNQPSSSGKKSNAISLQGRNGPERQGKGKAKTRQGKDKTRQGQGKDKARTGNVKTKWKNMVTCAWKSGHCHT